MDMLCRKEARWDTRREMLEGTMKKFFTPEAKEIAALSSGRAPRRISHLQIHETLHGVYPKWNRRVQGDTIGEELPDELYYRTTSF